MKPVTKMVWLLIIVILGASLYFVFLDKDDTQAPTQTSQPAATNSVPSANQDAASQGTPAATPEAAPQATQPGEAKN